MVLAKSGPSMQRERRMVIEYLMKYFSEYEHETQVRLGVLPATIGGQKLTRAEQYALNTFRRYADAIVRMPDRLILIEASITPSPGYISQIELYRRLIPLTEDIGIWREKPLAAQYVVAYEDPVVSMMARENNIDVVIFRPEWVDEYLLGLTAARRRPAKSGGLKIL